MGENASMQVQKPIFIIGAGRSGSTIFQEMLSRHPNVAWLSGLCNVAPGALWLHRYLMYAIDYPVVGRCLTSSLKPSECYDFWDFYCKGFRAPCRDLVARDVSNAMKPRLRRVLSKVLTRKRNRLLVKYTGWSRMGYLSEIFPDAKFIHILRDGRAVVNSVLDVDWWLGWRGPENWRRGELPPGLQEEWEKHDKSFAALAAIEWKMLLDAVESARRLVSESDFLELRYEDLCDDPSGLLREVVRFCGLDWSRKFKRSIDGFALRNTNFKWQEELSETQKDILGQVLLHHLGRFGYT
jgi:hypothetical protein